MPRKPNRHCQLTKPHPFTFSPFARSVARVANAYKVKSQIQNSKFHRKSSPNSSGDKLGYHSLADKSEPSESSDEEDFEGIVRADFAFFDPKPDDFHGVKVLLQTYLDDKQWDLSGFVDLILGQTTVGTIVKIEEDEDDTPYSVVTALNLRRYKHKNTGQKEATSNSSEEAIVYVKSEDEFFYQLSSWSFRFPLRTQQLASHEDVLKKGTGGWKKAVAAFGEDILQENGQVDRPKLGRIVFSDPDKRQLLNRLLAPYISSGIFWEILKLWLKGCKVIVLDIPLLFEAKMDKWTKPIIVVWVDPETQLQRLMARDRASVEDARNRIQAQMPLDVKITQADIVIDNTGSLEELNERFQKVVVQVTKPLTWTEFALSRQGALVAFISVFVGVIICRKAL